MLSKLLLVTIVFLYTKMKILKETANMNIYYLTISSLTHYDLSYQEFCEKTHYPYQNMQLNYHLLKKQHTNMFFIFYQQWRRLMMIITIMILTWILSLIIRYYHNNTCCTIYLFQTFSLIYS